MNLYLVVVGIIQILVSICVAILVFFLGFKALSKFTKEYDDEKEIGNNNVAVAIVSAMFLVCIGILLKVSLGPTLHTLRLLLISKVIDIGRVFVTLGFVFLNLAIGGVVAVGSLFFSFILFRLISPFKDLKAVMKNNIAVAIIIGAVMLVTVLLISEPLLFLLEGIAPKVEIPGV
jgi:uncharacterized membrane protein YjfL (UPF0719 family)